MHTNTNIHICILERTYKPTHTHGAYWWSPCFTRESDLQMHIRICTCKHTHNPIHTYVHTYTYIVPSGSSPSPLAKNEAEMEEVASKAFEEGKKEREREMERKIQGRKMDRYIIDGSIDS